MSAWRDWEPGVRVRHTRSGATGAVVKVNAVNTRVKVRWDVLNHQTWAPPSQLIEIGEPT